MRKTAVLFLAVILTLGLIHTAAGDTLVIPAGVKTIEDEAFRDDTSLDEVILPEGLKTIGAYAFAGSSVSRMYLPRTLKNIDETAFEGCDSLLCWGPTGTTGYNFCKAHQIEFENSNAKLRALLIGETDYTVRLNGPENDVACMNGMLNELGWTVTARTDATYEEIYELIDSTFERATSDDISLFFYSGHGVTGSSEYYSGALQTIDYQYISTLDLAEILSTIPGKVIVILDSCGSGAAVSDAGIQSNGDGGFDPKRFNAGVISAFRSFDTYIRPAGDDELSSNSGELRERKFHVVTSSAYEENSDTVLINNVWGGMLTRGAAAALGCTYPGAAYTGYMDADSDGDMNLSFREFAAYCKFYASERQDVQSYSKYPSLLIFRRPDGT